MCMAQITFAFTAEGHCDVLKMLLGKEELTHSVTRYYLDLAKPKSGAPDCNKLKP